MLEAALFRDLNFSRNRTTEEGDEDEDGARVG